MEKIKMFLKKIFEPSRLLVGFISGLCLFYSTGFGKFFIKSDSGILLLDLVNNVNWLNFIGSDFKLTIFCIVVELIGWSGFIYCFREICMKFHKDDDKVKFSYSVIIMTASIFIYTTTRILKNVAAVPKMAGAGISFLKLASTPFSIIAGILIMLVSVKVKPKNWANAIIIPFVGYFVLYFIFAYDKQWLLPSEEMLNSIFSHNNVINGDSVFVIIKKYLFKIISFIPRPCVENWPTSIFYMSAEAFGVACVVSLPYQILNVHMTKEQSKRWIPMILLIGQFATIVSGLVFRSLVEYDLLLVSLVNVGTVIISIAGGLLLLSNFLLFKRHSVEEVSNDKLKEKTKKRYSFFEILKILPVPAILIIFFNPIYAIPIILILYNKK